MPGEKLRQALFNERLKFLDPALLSAWVDRSRINPYWWVVILCALFILPAMFIRGAHYEEGTTVALAKSIFEDGLWPGTFRYGERLVDRPHAVTWLLGAVGYLIGSLPLWVARLPTILSLIAGASLVYALVRRYASATAALFAVVCLIASPMMLQKTITAESDVEVSMLLFAGFVLFWRTYEAGGPTFSGWIVIGAIIALASLLKGPHPLGYFFLGVGAFLLLRRQWASFICLGVIGIVAAAVVSTWYYVVYQSGDWAIWEGHSRLELLPPIHWIIWSIRFCLYLAVENLPGLLLFAPCAWIVFRRGAPKADDLVVALALYAGVCTVALVLWPGANGRYAMPATFAVAAGAGLAFERFREQRQLLVRGTLGLAGLLVAFRLIVNWVAMPLVPDKFREQAVLGQQVTALAKAPARLLVSDRGNIFNLLVHVSRPARVVPPEIISQAQPPFWAIVMPDQLAELQNKYPAAGIAPLVSGPSNNPWKLVEVRGN
jgi:4-amino-4-deoxy-L-arabinose transferase-like glycosyltransferase